jgi:hypothetical protein
VAYIFKIATPNLMRSGTAASEARRARTRPASVDVIKPDAFFGELQKLATDRKQIVTATLELRVDDPRAAAESVNRLARRLGGHVERSSLSADAPGMHARVVMRVPADALWTALGDLRALGSKLEAESVETKDVTAEYVDAMANVRNLQSEEAQYRQIMTKAGKVADALEAAEKLANVRGRAQRTEAQMKLADRQARMATVQVILRSEESAQLAAVGWNPAGQARAAWHDAAQDLNSYAGFLLVMLIRLPVLALWALTIVAMAIVAMRIMRRVWKRFAPSAPAPPPEPVQAG